MRICKNKSNLLNKPATTLTAVQRVQAYHGTPENQAGEAACSPYAGVDTPDFRKVETQRHYLEAMELIMNGPHCRRLCAHVRTIFVGGARPV